MKTKKDKIFGQIIYKDLWLGSTELAIFGETKKIELSIYGEEDEEFTSNQQEAFVNFTKKMQEISKESEMQIFKYYLENVEDYRAMKIDLNEVDKVAQRIPSIDKLKQLVIPKGLLLQYDFGDDIRRVGLLFDCSWEPEHGLAVKIENEKVIEVGFQDIVL